MIRIGIVGIGFMGMIHYLAAQKLKNAKVTAICSRDPKKLSGDWRGIRGNFGPPGQKMELAGVKRYDRLEAMLADPDIDLVDICNPTVLHPATAIAALRTGKHVLVEKPIALELKDADGMLKAAGHAGKLLMVAHVLPFTPEFAFAADNIRGGKYGRLLGAHFNRAISRPDCSADIAVPARTGGPAIDLHIHDTHFIAFACGAPNRVFASGLQQDGTVQYLTTQYLYDAGGPAVSCSSGAVAQKGRPFVHGYEVYLERATLVYESGAVPLTVYTADGKSKQPRQVAGGELAGFTRELQAAVAGVRRGHAPELLSGELARDALALCLKECLSVQSGKPVPVASQA